MSWPRIDQVSDSIARPWWRRLEIAAVLLVVAVLAGYLTVANQGRRVVPALHTAGGEVPPAAVSSQPVQLKIPAIGVDAPIETREAAAVPVLIPAASGPWVVAWRDDSARPGEGGNVVLEGHVDYWPDGHAVFWNLAKLQPGDRIDVAGANQTVFSYTVEWSRRYPLAAATAAQQREILGPTPAESVTLITAAGEYDRATGLYPEVLVVRARFDTFATPEAPDPAECRVAPLSMAELDAATAAVNNGPDEYLEYVPAEDVMTLPSEPASVPVLTEVTATSRELAACLNAGDALRTYALYTDTGLLRILDSVSGMDDPLGRALEWVPDFSELAAATPLPENRRLMLLAIDDVQVLADGRVKATLTIGPGRSGIFGVKTGQAVTYIFVRDGRYRIDGVVNWE